MSRLSKLVKEGLFNAVGACEMKAATMERALKVCFSLLLMKGDIYELSLTS